MTEAPLLVLVATVALAATAGLAVGLTYFRLLRRSVDALAQGGGWRTASLLGAARFAAAALLFGLAARFGAVALLASFAGFLLARGLMLRGARKTA